MNSRIRFSANACLLSAMSGLVAGSAGGLLGQSDVDPLKSRVVQAAGSESASTPQAAMERPQLASPRPAAALAAGTGSGVPRPAAQAASGTQNGRQSFTASKNVPSRIQQTAGTAAVPARRPSAQGNQSAVQRELEMMYRRDGRAMPPMTLSEIPIPDNGVPIPPPRPATSANHSQPAPERPNLFKRILTSIGLRKEQPVPPAYVPPAKTAQPAGTPYVVSSQPVPPQFRHPVTPNAVPPADSQKPRLFPGVETPDRPSLAASSSPARNDFFDLEDEEEEFMDDGDEGNESPSGNTDNSSLAGRNPLNEADLGGSLEGNAGGEAAGPEQNPVASQTAESPYTGLKLIPNDSEGMQVARAKPELEDENLANDDEDMDVDDSKNQHASDTSSPETERGRQLKLLAAHSEMKGLKGFCPVTLKNQRQLAVGKPGFTSVHESRTYKFATAEAKAEFDEHPERYVPAFRGTDVVCRADKQGDVEGTLQHAAWYKGRLYLFSTVETRDRFVESPRQFVPNPPPSL